ncbi:MAG: type I methionyl aminopeptidase [Candidatus Nanopelagicales bacterium]
MFRAQDRIEIKTVDQIQAMRAAGLVVARTLQRVAEITKAGITTAEMDDRAAQSILDEGATPSFLGYHGFPAHICVSVNEEVVHGIPGPRRLADGDVVSIDCGAIVDGWHGDAAITVLVGDVAPELVELSRVTEESLWAGLAAARPGHRLSDIGHAVERCIRGQGAQYGIVEEYVGHGIGTRMHMEPPVPNYGRPGRGPRLVPGMALAVEPMVVLGDAGVHTLDDDWTVVASDGSHASHWEHTVAVTDEGPWVLTALDDVRL